MANIRKSTVIYVEVGADKKAVTLEAIQKAVKAVEGVKTAYLNAAEGKIYCVDADGKPIEPAVEL